MKILTLPLTSLMPSPDNPRKPLRPGDKAYRKLRRSLEQFGLIQPLVWNRRTGHLVSGHQRFHILQQMGVKKALVAVVDLPRAKELALNVLLNNREAQSEWHLPTLTAVLNKLHQPRHSLLASTGFDQHHLEILRSQLRPVDPCWNPGRLEPLAEIVLTVPLNDLDAIKAHVDQILTHRKVLVQSRLRHRIVLDKSCLPKHPASQTIQVGTESITQASKAASRGSSTSPKLGKSGRTSKIFRS